MPLTVQVGAGPFSFQSACLLPHYLFSRSGNTKNTVAFLSAQPQFKILGCFYAMSRYRGHTVSSALLYTNSLGRAQILSLPLAKASSLVFGRYWGHVLNLRFWRHRCLNASYAQRQGPEKPSAEPKPHSKPKFITGRLKV